MKFAGALGFVLVGLIGRALIDKLLALRGGAELVAVWAQLSSLVEIVAGVTLAGIGIGLTGLVAGKARHEQQRLLTDAVRLGLPVSGVCLLALVVAGVAGGNRWLPPEQAVSGLAALIVGWLSVAPGLLMAMLLGGGRAGLAALLSAGSFLLPLGGVVLAGRGDEPLALLAGYAMFGAALTLWAILRCVAWSGNSPRPGTANALRPFVMAGLAIGVLSPLAVAVARSGIATGASWDMVGTVQALWRSSDWITAVVAGLLNAYYLPRLAAAPTGPGFRSILRQSGQQLVLPAIAALALLWAALPVMLGLLYRDDMVISRIDALPFFLGDALRMASWIFLFGLFARRAGRRIGIGELLSLPLFALLIAAWPAPLTLAAVGAAWLLAYAAYLAFNVWALRGRLPAA